MTKMIYESPDKGETIRERPFHQPIQQIKSNWYYVFWGIMSLAVIGGQIYVGTGYREMARATKSTSIGVTCVPQYVVDPSKMNKFGEFE